MAIDERTRHQLHQRLEETLGADEAATLMAMLPPVGWADVATKHDLFHDLTALEERLDLRIELGEQRVLATLRGELNTQTRTFLLAMLAANATLAGLAFGAARLA